MPSKQATRTAIELIAEMIDKLPKAAKKRGENMLSEVPSEVIEAFQAQALRDALEDPAALAYSNPETFTDLAMPITSWDDPIHEQKIGVLQKIMRGEPVEEYTDLTSSEGRGYMNSYGPEFSPGFDEIPRLHFAPEDPYSLRTVGHEGRHRSYAMQDEGLPGGLIRLEPPSIQYDQPPGWSDEVREMASDPSTLTYSQPGEQTGAELKGPAGALWKLLGLAPVVGAANAE